MFTLKPSGKVYWTRLILAVLTAWLCAFLDLSGWRGVFFGIFMYLASYYIVRYGLNITPESVGSASKLMLTGIGTFIFVWLMTWTLLYTIRLVQV